MMRLRAPPVCSAVVRVARTHYPRRPIHEARQSSSSASVVRTPEQRRGDQQADAELKHLSYGCRAAPVLSCQADQLNSLRQRGFCVVARSPRLGQGELAVCNRSVHISCRSILHSSLVTPTAAHVSMIRDNVWLQPQRNKRSRNSLISRSRAASPPVCEASAHSCVPALHARTDRSTYRLRQETK